MAERIDGKRGKTVAEERRELMRKWENTPSPNPEFKGITPRQVARKLLENRSTGRNRS